MKNYKLNNAVKNKKLAIISHEIYPVLSGGAVYVEKIAHELCRMGFEVEILSQNIKSDFTKVELKDGYKIIRFWTGRQGSGNATIIEHLLFLFVGMPQIIYHLHIKKIKTSLCLFVIPAGLVGYFSKFILRAKYISILDGGDLPNIKSDVSILVKILKPLFLFVNRNSDAVALLEGLDEVALPFLRNVDFYKVQSGINIPKKMSKPGSNKLKKLRILSIGRLTKRKGFDLIIKACKIVIEKNDNFHLMIAGYGKEEESLRSLVNKLDLGRNVTLTGRVEYFDLPELYLNSDCYVFFGDVEGQSLAMMDALAYGLPIVCSKHPGNTIFIENGVNGFSVDYPNVKKLSEKILFLMNNYSLLKKMGGKSRSIAKNHSWRNVALTYKRIINKIEN